ncbi:MAG: hypothetical protein KIT72_08770 [Polyangiaceae bacterium]|nr:hypothetical protein [Polyangiaceae bacterium]MCW5790501.1 hypothetical protein [Polyangiaceae bacterium]
MRLQARHRTSAPLEAVSSQRRVDALKAAAASPRGALTASSRRSSPGGVGALTALTAALFAMGCGAEFDPPHKVTSLRVLGVQKDKPYAKPGDDVTLSLLWHDSSEQAPRPVQVAWYSGCFNPPGDLYYGCFEALSGGGGNVGLGEQHTVSIPSDIISSRPPPRDPELVPYGLSYVFFAVCAGQLGPAPAEQGFPVACFDDQGKQLGADDFVAGYSGIYAYDTFENQNPVITGFEFNGRVVEPDCIGAECLSNPPAPSDDCSRVACVDSCADDGDPTCPGIAFRPLISSSVAEVDDIALVSEGRNLTEQMWVNYYIEDGGLKSSVRLLNDATKGWNEDFGTEYYAPKQPGDYKLWAVARDNRGGSEWIRITVRVR